MRLAALTLACTALVLSSARAAAPKLQFGKPVVALASCPKWFAAGTQSCYEPSVAVDSHGWLFVTSVAGQLIARSTDGGATFSQLRAPDSGIANAEPSDTILQTDRVGDLYYSTLLVDPVQGYASYIQVARSVNGGASWQINVNVPVSPPDRQWLAFGANGVVYLVYRTAYPAATSVRRSADGGLTWGSPVEIPGTIIGGRPVVDPNGRLFVPFIGPTGIAVAISSDGGKSFAISEVSPQPGDFFTNLDSGADGRLALAWLDGNDTLNLSTSSDHGQSWHTRSAIAPHVATSPWILVRQGGDLDLAWAVQTGPNALYRLARVPWSGPVPQPVDVATMHIFQGNNPANTDYTNFTHLPDDRVAAVWASGDSAPTSSVYVAAEKPPFSSAIRHPHTRRARCNARHPHGRRGAPRHQHRRRGAARHRRCDSRRRP